MEQLNNLARIGTIHSEPPDSRELRGLVASARDRLKDVNHNRLSDAGQFDLAYNAAHALALAALRYHGFRSDNRYQVFQCLVHTVGLSAARTQLFAQCHHRRNIAEYEGHLDIPSALLNEFTQAANELLQVVEELIK